MSNLRSMKNARQSNFFKIRERNANRLSRQSEEKKLEERNLSLISKQNARQCNQYRLKEALQKRNRRILHEFRVKENEQERQSKWKARLDKWYFEKERLAKQASRLKSKNGNVGSILDCKQKAINHRKFSTNEQVLSKRRKYGSDISSCIQMFCYVHTQLFLACTCVYLFLVSPVAISRTGFSFVEYCSGSFRSFLPSDY